MAKRTTAFSERHMGVLRSTIDQMKTDRLGFEVPPLTLDDILNTFIKEEDRYVMQRAADLVNDPYKDRMIKSSVHTSQFGPAYVYIRLAGTKPDGSPMFFVPKYAYTDMKMTFTLGSKFDDYLCSVINARIDFNYVTKVLSLLNEMCTMPAHVAFFWPSIRIIAEHAAKFDPGMGSKLQDLVSTTTNKPLPYFDPRMRTACAETAEIVTAAHILGKPETRIGASGYSVSVLEPHRLQRETPIGPIHAN